MTAFWSSLNCTPTRDNAPIPAMGSLRAFPTCTVADCKSIPIACDISKMELVAASKFSPRIWVNVAKTFSAPRIASSLNSDIPAPALSAPARLAISSAVFPAAPPVDAITAVVCARALCQPCASLIPSVMTPPSIDSPVPTALIAASPMRRMAPPAISPRTSKPPPAVLAASVVRDTASVTASDAVMASVLSAFQRRTIVCSAISKPLAWRRAPPPQSPSSQGAP